MDATQLLLSVAVTITTALLIVVGLQLISLLRHYKHSSRSQPEPKKPEIKKDKIVQKKINLTSLLGKIKILTPSVHSNKKRFFKSS